MTQKSVREELERQLEQAQRMAKSQPDPLTRERLDKLMRDLEDQLK
jgi:hypothetical protein